MKTKEFKKNEKNITKEEKEEEEEEIFRPDNYLGLGFSNQ